MAFPKFHGNRFKIDREISENHAILVVHFYLTLDLKIYVMSDRPI